MIQRAEVAIRINMLDPVVVQVRNMSQVVIERTIADLDRTHARVHGKDPNRQRRAHMRRVLIHELQRRLTE